MDDSLSVDVPDRLTDLSENPSHGLLRQLPFIRLRAHVVEEGNSVHVFHHQINVLLRLKVVQEFDNVLMFQLLHCGNFSLNCFLLSGVVELVLRVDLYRYSSLGLLVLS